MSIDLSPLVGEDVVVLAGTERGVAAREQFGLDSLDKSDEDVSIVAPSNLEAISPSFVQGFFSKSFVLLGEEGIKRKYRFDLTELLAEDMLDGLKRLKMQRTIAGH